MVSGDALFAATGVTYGSMLSGIKIDEGLKKMMDWALEYGLKNPQTRDFLKPFEYWLNNPQKTTLIK